MKTTDPLKIPVTEYTVLLPAAMLSAITFPISPLPSDPRLPAHYFTDPALFSQQLYALLPFLLTLISTSL